MTEEPLLRVLDGAQLPRTGKRMPSVGRLRAGNTVPFAKGLPQAQRWVGAFTLEQPMPVDCVCRGTA